MRKARFAQQGKTAHASRPHRSTGMFGAVSLAQAGEDRSRSRNTRRRPRRAGRRFLDLPKCDDATVLSTIRSGFGETESTYWGGNAASAASRKCAKSGFAQRPRVRSAPLLRRPGRGSSTPRLPPPGEPKTHTVVYAVVSAGGLIGWNWGVQWCVVGFDRMLAYAPDCDVLRRFSSAFSARPGPSSTGCATRPEGLSMEAVLVGRLGLRAGGALALLPAAQAGAPPTSTAPFDYYVMALSWSSGFSDLCSDRKSPRQFANGAGYGFVVHGLSPDNPLVRTPRIPIRTRRLARRHRGDERPLPHGRPRRLRIPQARDLHRARRRRLFAAAAPSATGSSIPQRFRAYGPRGGSRRDRSGRRSSTPTPTCGPTTSP